MVLDVEVSCSSSPTPMEVDEVKLKSPSAADAQVISPNGVQKMGATPPSSQDQADMAAAVWEDPNACRSRLLNSYLGAEPPAEAAASSSATPAPVAQRRMRPSPSKGTMHVASASVEIEEEEDRWDEAPTSAQTPWGGAMSPDFDSPVLNIRI